MDFSTVHFSPGFNRPLAYDPSAARHAKDAMCIGRPMASLLRLEDMDESGEATLPLTMLREFAMLQFMNAVTDKPDWHIKVFDDKVTTRWKQEAVQDSIAVHKKRKELDADDSDYEEHGEEPDATALPWPIHTVPRNETLLTEETVTQCIAELQHRARTFPQSPDGAIFVYNGDVYKSDTAVSEETRLALEDAVRSLEDVPEPSKDWHPSSDGLVLDLVHPSLFPLMYGKTRVLPIGTQVTSLMAKDCIKRSGEGVTIGIPKVPRRTSWGRQVADEAYSSSFQWLPCEVDISGDRARIISYINNLHPEEHLDLYSIIEDIVTASIPLWERTLAWLADEDSCWDRPKRIHCFEPEYDPNPEGLEEGSGPQLSDVPLERLASSEEANSYLKSVRQEWIESSRKLVTPEPDDFDPNMLEKSQPPRFSLKNHVGQDGRPLQVIVKLANIHLTPEKPEYEGGTWHVEGKLNERIVATALYYYSSFNITPVSLSFRQLSQHGIEPNGIAEHLDDYDWLETIYGVRNSGSAVQYVGSVETRQGRLLTFPNILQHRVGPFSLDDRTKPGHRKILALFLVDPNVRIISTASVPAQRMDWWIRELEKDAPEGSRSLLRDLPSELREIVFDQVEEFPIRVDDAKRVRESLMEERRAFTLGHGSMLDNSTISLCEH